MNSYGGGGGTTGSGGVFHHRRLLVMAETSWRSQHHYAQYLNLICILNAKQWLMRSVCINGHIVQKRHWVQVVLHKQWATSILPPDWVMLAEAECMISPMLCCKVWLIWIINQASKQVHTHRKALYSFVAKASHCSVICLIHLYNTCLYNIGV